MQKRRSRTRSVRCRRGVNRLGGAWRRSGRQDGRRAAATIRRVTGSVSTTSSRWSVCEAHDPTGEPGAGNRHAGFGERGTGNAAKGAGLRPEAKAAEQPPDPKAGAPAPDSTAPWKGAVTQRVRTPPGNCRSSR